ncbi:hypothetical protein F0L74_21925 [Chitinophaga agrisoli]|uniref:Dolichyl-phosphate-mannose-protein mannosyltransferase n=1 Tax=Chitinophaga agrisoli TaxID=2607653 RepID=A0A5B2VK05_9BACT|nr:hypothetical protein [Chitinophaga agrisoli]KAA2238876.1 hypothetical protein F0L74_21925 [Chitinophaga agrisoli]
MKRHENGLSSFPRYVLSRGARWYLVIALIGIIVQLIVFKQLYPFADFYSDSYSYIFAARTHLEVSIQPMGYAWFLALFHAITSSDTAVVIFQYMFLQLAALYAFFTFLYLYQPARTARNILFVFLLFNPVSLYLGNHISADALFTGLSLCWLAQLVRVIQSPHRRQVLAVAIVLLLLFVLDTRAYYYLLISAMAFLLSRQKAWIKLSGIVLPLLLILPYVLYTRQAAREMTGAPQLAFANGWQSANNALHMYGHIRVDTAALPAESRELDSTAKAYFAKLPAGFDGSVAFAEGHYFLQQLDAPLKRYRDQHYKLTNDYSRVLAYGKAATVFGPYGRYLIRHHPGAYARYFMWPAAGRYFLPPLEKYAMYNGGSNVAAEPAQEWFAYKSNLLKPVSVIGQGKVLGLFPILFLICNICFLGCLLCLPGLRDHDGAFQRTVWLFGGYWLVNFVCSVFSGDTALRYQYFPMLLLLAAVALVADAVYKTAAEKEKQLA